MRPYVYEPLDLSSSTFRLVRLVQGDGPHIECDLFHAALYDTVDAVEYEALSYTWGGDDKSHKIEIDGTTLSVTESLFDALVHLRYQEEDRILWIDAICIDQDDHKERGHQVRHMAAIYENARQVIFWLGLSNEDTDLVFSRMQKLEKGALGFACSDWAPTDNRWKFLWSSVMLPRKKPHRRDEDRLRSEFCHLLARSWFKRVWILQEVANARRAKVMCGDKTVSSRIFAVMPNILGVSVDAHTRAVLDIMPGPSRKHSWWAQKRDLSTLLIKFSQAKASDPRDNVYALLGISSDAYDTDFLRPDYNKPLVEVVKATVGFLLNLGTRKDLQEQLPAWTLNVFWRYQNSLPTRVVSEAWRLGQQQLCETLLDRAVVLRPTSWLLEFDHVYYRTPLAWAAQANREDLVEEFLRYSFPDVNVNKQDWLGSTPLQVAVENGQDDIAWMLLQHDEIVPDMCDWFGKTPLSWAAGQGQVNLVQMLLESGHFSLDWVDKSGWTPLSLAEANGHHEVVAVLKNYIPDDFARDRSPPKWQRRLA